jgi:NhaP-type Na+/H+ or K+/H+ antiporter
METNWKEILVLVVNVTVLRLLWPAIYILVNKEPGSQWTWGEATNGNLQ